jgi:hypothetical protein
MLMLKYGKALSCLCDLRKMWLSYGLACLHRDHSERLVPLNDRNLIIMIANTNVKHALGDSQYPVRVKQCKAAVQAVSGLPI